MLNTGETEVDSLKKRTNCYFYTMNILYLLNLVLACFSYFGPFCTQQNLYPKCMSIACALYVINYMYHYYLHKNNYFLQWKGLKILNEKQDPKLNNQTPLVQIEPEPIETVILKQKMKLYKEQMKVYSHYSFLVSIWGIGIQVLAYVSKHDGGFLGCMESGWQWEYTSIFGSLFTMFHMMSILMQTIMVMKIFYCVPQAQGWFAKKEE